MNLCVRRPGGLSAARPAEIPADDHDLVFYIFSPSVAAQRGSGVLQIRLPVFDPSGQPDANASLEGATFEATDSDDARLAAVLSNCGWPCNRRAPADRRGTRSRRIRAACWRGSAVASVPDGNSRHCKVGIIRFADPRTGAPGDYGS
jgi:hypothetical protein